MRFPPPCRPRSSPLLFLVLPSSPLALIRRRFRLSAGCSDTSSTAPTPSPPPHPPPGRITLSDSCRLERFDKVVIFICFDDPLALIVIWHQVSWQENEVPQEVKSYTFLLPHPFLWLSWLWMTNYQYNNGRWQLPPLTLSSFEVDSLDNQLELA
ncbi:hypothetical protein OPV22_024957 [Ensete ventricosum]|uniref:Uncharacterized protein n=1 Tax=Ensete ventricosum TaxID=4639 RepID=A0AAV8QI47_ENSVE|nr:hypothetical protein OPV22_024957 [Ensete ventricosum]